MHPITGVGVWFRGGIDPVNPWIKAWTDSWFDGTDRGR